MASLKFSESPEYITIANKPMGEENYGYQFGRLTDMPMVVSLVNTSGKSGLSVSEGQ